MTTKLLTDFADLQRLASEWGRLWEANPNREIFGKFSWIESWWQGFGGDSQLLSPAVYEDGKVLGILPLRIENRMLRFVGDPEADYNDLICDPGRKVDVLGAAIAALDGSPYHWDSCKLENVPESSLIAGARVELSSNLRSRTEMFVSAVCPTVLLGEDRVDTLKSILGKATVSRRIRQLQKLGALKFRLLDDHIQAREHLPALIQQHIRCRALAGIRSQLLDQRSRDFFGALVNNLNPETDLRFSVLELGDRPIAYNLGFELDGKYLYYTPTYDIDFFDLSPGEVLLRYLFTYAQDNGLKEFDFTVGDESYKSRYANKSKRNFEFHLYPRTAAGRIAQLAHAAKERLRSHPAVYRAAKSITSAATASVGRINRVVRRDGLVRAALKLVIQVFRSVIFSRDEVLVLTFLSHKVTPPHSLTFRAATLSDLADAAVTYPEYLTGETLHGLRERIKKGHTPFVALDNGDIVHVIWLRVEDRIATTELGEDFVLELGRPVGLMYDAWTPSVARGKSIYPTVLSLLGLHILGLGLEPYIYVASDNVASRRGMAKSGMEVQYRMTRYEWFHWMRRCIARKTSQIG